MFNLLAKGILLGTLLTTSLSADKVVISTDNTGDFLIAPIYIAEDDVCTEVKVFNTNTTSSILAKVVFRERIASHEVDLPIFLSPGDVWNATVCRNVNGVVSLTSTDDSNHPSAMQTLKYGQSLFDHSNSSNYRRADFPKSFVEIEGKEYEIKGTQKENIDFSRGYIEVFPIAQFYEGSTQKVGKRKLVERWDMLERGITAIKGLSKSGVDSYSLSGLVSFQTRKQETSSIPMTAFKGAHDKQLKGHAISYTTDANTEILLGKDKKIAILKLLQKDTLSFMYDNAGVDQYLNILFPFSHKEMQSRRYRITIRDMQENKYTMIFSPILKIDNELVCLSVENLIQLTRDTIKFKEGMIQITGLMNNDKVQLGKDQIASMIPTLSRVSTLGKQKVVINTTYISVKKRD
ncbi:MAG: hypothetical protein U9R42_06250 [Bacteroidota bacterium]|nr:hypothetical protein [Bacteroidota bacterium]